jgi:glycosyltransferase involved in cell wall biosynthesis
VQRQFHSTQALVEETDRLERNFAGSSNNEDVGQSITFINLAATWYGLRISGCFVSIIKLATVASISLASIATSNTTSAVSIADIKLDLSANSCSTRWRVFCCYNLLHSWLPCLIGEGLLVRLPVSHRRRLKWAETNAIGFGYCATCGGALHYEKPLETKRYSRSMLIHVIPAIANEASGPSYSVTRLCSELVDQGQAVTLATLDWGLIASPFPFLKTFPLGYGPSRLGRSPSMRRWLVSAAKNGTVDLIHNHSLWMMPNVYSCCVSRRRNLPLVVSPRGTLSERAFSSGSMAKLVFWPMVQHPALRATTCFHATAHSEYEDIRRMGFRQPVAVIPNGIDIRPPKQSNNSEKRTLLFLGRIHPIKGVDMLLEAWRIVSPRFQEWKLRIVGPDNGGYLARMQNLAAEFKLARVEFSGPLYGKVKLKSYQDAELFVLPTHSENFGMSVVEALAAGTPVIVSKGAPWEGLVSEGAGWWIDIGLDPLVACLETALASPREALHAKGKKGRDWMQRDFSWAEIARKTRETYQWILHGGDIPACVREE